MQTLHQGQSGVDAHAKEGLHNLLRERIATLRGARSLAYLLDMSRSLRSVRLALRPLATVVQTFPKQVSHQRGLASKATVVPPRFGRWGIPRGKNARPH